MKTALYIHGFNGNPKGGTYEGLTEYFKDKPDWQVISFPFPKLHTDVATTQQEIEQIVDEHQVTLIIGASLGGFYTLCCQRPVHKIVINPCMKPSIEIPLLKDRETGLPIQIDETVLQQWKQLEQYELAPEYKQAAGIFGKQDDTFHYDENHNYSPLFREVFGNDVVMVEGKHSLEGEQIREGITQL